MSLFQLSGSVGRIVGGSTRKKLSLRNGEDLLGKMWSCLRANNGIMVRATRGRVHRDTLDLSPTLKVVTR